MTPARPLCPTRGLSRRRRRRRRRALCRPGCWSCRSRGPPGPGPCRCAECGPSPRACADRRRRGCRGTGWGRTCCWSRLRRRPGRSAAWSGPSSNRPAPPRPPPAPPTARSPLLGARRHGGFLRLGPIRQAQSVCRFAGHRPPWPSPPGLGIMIALSAQSTPPGPPKPARPKTISAPLHARLRRPWLRQRRHGGGRSGGWRRWRRSPPRWPCGTPWPRAAAGTAARPAPARGTCWSGSAYTPGR
jgi:hypothetical protein